MQKFVRRLAIKDERLRRLLDVVGRRREAVCDGKLGLNMEAETGS
jgi:hypothetical protein